MANDFKEQLQNILPLEVAPLKIGTLGYAVSVRLCYVFKRGSSRYGATPLHGYTATGLHGYLPLPLVLVLARTWLVSAHGLKNALDSCVACSFQLMDYCYKNLKRIMYKSLLLSHEAT